MDEKQAVADTLAGVNALLNMLAYNVMQSNNKSLRDTFVTYRNQLEDLQWQNMILILLDIYINLNGIII